MSVTVKPIVLHVDDEPEELRAWEEEVASRGDVDLILRHPQDLGEDDVRNASVVLVDYRIDHWPERAHAPSIALRPLNGLAVISVLQGLAWELDPTKPRAFGLYTALMSDVARGLTDC